jgi:predicted nucleotidyltransferase component of viral defense system
MEEPSFSKFVLVGGTALALQIGHRISIDIDLFGDQELEEADILSVLSEFDTVKIIKKSKNIIICSVGGIKVDFVNYPYPFIDKVICHENIRLASTKDIAAMKLNAIAGRGSKKDFVDLYFLLKAFSMEEMIRFYMDKYQDGSEFMVRKSLTYFEDADLQIDPILFDPNEWDTMKKIILDNLNS